MVEVATRVRGLKGNIHRATTPSIIRAVLESFLACRRRGDPEPASYIKFYDRYLLERQVAELPESKIANK